LDEYQALQEAVRPEEGLVAPLGLVTPSSTPSVAPSTEPSAVPSVMPSTEPSGVPSVEPSTEASVAPSVESASGAASEVEALLGAPKGDAEDG